MGKQIFTFSGQLISCTTIARVQAENDSVYYYLITGEKTKSMLSIDSLKEELPADYFVKLKNKTLVNKYVAKRIRIKNDSYIYFPDGYTIKVSKEEYSLIRQSKGKTLKDKVKENIVSLFM